MYRSVWSALVSSRSTEKVIRSTRVAATALAAAQLGWHELLQQASYVDIQGAADQVVLELHCTVTSVSLLEGEGMVSRQRLNDTHERRIQAALDQEQLATNYDRDIPPGTIEIIPENREVHSGK